MISKKMSQMFTDKYEDFTIPSWFSEVFQWGPFFLNCVPYLDDPRIPYSVYYGDHVFPVLP